MKTLYKWLIGCLGVILLLFLALQFIVTPWLETKAERLLEESSSDQFRLTANNLEINLFRRAVKTDSSAFFILMPASKSDSTIVNELKMQLTSIHATGISIWHLLMNDKLSLSQLHLVQPDLMVIKKIAKKVKKSAGQSDFNILAVSISDLKIDSSSFTYWDSLEVTSFHTEVGSIQGAVELLLPDGASPTIDPEYSFLDLKNGNISLPGDYYDVNFRQCNISGKKSSIHIDSLKLIPLLEKYEFSQKYGYRTDRVVMDVSEIQINDLDVKNLVDKGKFNAGMLTTTNMNFDIFRDARLPFSPTKHTILLQRKISQLPFAFTIDSTNITDSYLRYEEKRLDELGTGHLELEDLNIFGNRITNDSSLIEETVYKVNGEALFMGQGELSASIEFPMDRINGYHTVSGHLGPMSLPTVNQVLYPLTKFRIENGQNDNVYFNMALDETEATGDLRFYYHDLKVNMETEKEKWLNDISSFLANRLIREENPKNGKFRRGIISYERDTKRSIFNYWWKSLRSGLLTSVGISPGVTEEE